jgi:uncharacterized protein YacL (UPF0231 family)
MEFKFKTDTLNDSYRVDFSMEHEAFGRWLMSELGTEPQDIKALLVIIAEMKTLHEVEKLIEGRDFSLTLTNNNVLVIANSLHLDDELPAGEDLSHYDDESTAECGLEDFEMMLQSWLEFVQ